MVAPIDAKRDYEEDEENGAQEKTDVNKDGPVEGNDKTSTPGSLSGRGHKDNTVIKRVDEALSIAITIELDLIAVWGAIITNRFFTLFLICAIHLQLSPRFLLLW